MDLPRRGLAEPALLCLNQGGEASISMLGAHIMVKVHRPVLVVALAGVALVALSASGTARQVTEAFCKDPATQRAVEADAKRQRLLRAPLEIRSVQFEYVDFSKGGRFCVYSMVTTNGGDKFEFAVTPKGERHGVPRFKFQHLD